MLPSANSAAAVQGGRGQGSESEQKEKISDYVYIPGFYKIWHAADSDSRMDAVGLLDTKMNSGSSFILLRSTMKY